MCRISLSFFVILSLNLSWTLYAQVDTLKISGTKYLCDIIQNILPDFYAVQPNCVVKFISSDNTPRTQSDFMLQGTDVALTTQPLSEKDKKKITFPYKEQVFAKDAIVFYTSNKNNVKGLTIAQINEIYAEKINNWSSINGKNEKIILIAYPLGHDFTLQLYKNVWQSEYYSINALVVENTEQFQNKLNASHYTIGYTAQSNKVKGNIIPILVSGTAIIPNEGNILSNLYPLTYTCYCAINTQKNSANKFLEWLTSPDTKKKLKTYHLYSNLL